MLCANIRRSSDVPEDAEGVGLTGVQERVTGCAGLGNIAPLVSLMCKL
jgi:hypothetical protein